MGERKKDFNLLFETFKTMNIEERNDALNFLIGYFAGHFDENTSMNEYEAFGALHLSLEQGKELQKGENKWKKH